MLSGVTVEAVSRNVQTVRVGDVKAGWKMRVLLRSDAHQDNPKALWDLELAHLDELKAENGLCFDFGDAFCAMQGKYDKRSSLDSVRPEHRFPNYLDRLVDTTVARYLPYSDNLALFALGNHETSQIDRNGVNLTERLVGALRQQNPASPVLSGGYGGWVRFMFSMSGIRTQIRMKYYHGNGGDSPVTRGVIDTARQGAVQPDAEVVVNGHNHNNYILPIPRERLTDEGRVTHDTQWFLRTGTYKDEYQDGYGGWMVERTKGGPKALGAIWGEFSYRNHQILMRFWADVVGNVAKPVAGSVVASETDEIVVAGPAKKYWYPRSGD